MINKDIYYVGVNDHQIDLFEGQFVVENGMAYNSYVIMDDKIAIMDSVDAKFTDEWLANIDKVLNGRTPDYLIVSHMEPDHSANIDNLVNKYPNITVVGTMMAFKMMKQFFNKDYQKIVVKEKDILNLGKHSLTFIMAPNVHWPEVMVTYDMNTKTLFSADAFGKFGALDVEEDWACEARRYYFGIVGRFGAQVQMLLNKLASYEIEMICPLHGPILDNNLAYYLNLYQTWSKYETETEGVMIAYTSVYGHTKKAVELLKDKLEANNCKVVFCDLAREDMAEAVEDAFRYGKLVLATTTYNADIFPTMKVFIDALIERNYQKKKLAFIENGSWGPIANKIMKAMFEKCKDITYLDTNITILSSISDKNIAEIDSLAAELLK
ncbi:MAG: FprA family A-type flavoprotein [Erysipelotrichaceae bacterium]|nr:FprA family A-type flavoprotein [Erysipelotrichaceae bacterium]